MRQLSWQTPRTIKTDYYKE